MSEAENTDCSKNRYQHLPKRCVASTHFMILRRGTANAFNHDFGCPCQKIVQHYWQCYSFQHACCRWHDNSFSRSLVTVKAGHRHDNSVACIKVTPLFRSCDAIAMLRSRSLARKKWLMKKKTRRGRPLLNIPTASRTLRGSDRHGDIACSDCAIHCP